MGCEKNYTSRRHFGFAIITAIAFVLPFIKINDSHFFLLSFDKSKLHLLFTQFDMQELYLMPFLFIILFLFIFFLTTLGGRVWCGWSCPQTIFRSVYRDLIQTKILKIYKNIKDKQKQQDVSVFKRALSVIIWACLSVLIASNFLWYFVPPQDFFAYLSDWTNHKVLVGFLACITLWLVFDVCFLKENFCVYVCPYARIQSTMFDNDTIQVLYNEERGGKIYDKGTRLWKKPQIEGAQCTGCEACVKICPTHIDIRKGMQLECINCLECSDACSKVMAKFNFPSLIEWTSENAQKTHQKVKYLRFRTIAYVAILSVASVVLVLMSGKKEHMLLNINRTSELYNITKDKNVENSYTFLFQNTDSKKHTYYFDTNDTNIKIVRPSEPIEVKPNHKQRVIVILGSKNLNLNDQKDMPITIKINAYAVDEKEKISVDRETVFVYPKKQNLN
ncbi:cytochrome c oxidase accessory protein CcoG [Campylobacter sp. RM9328]|uniref:cytochrome c oxidase accessory protein CcoG n=1 Tax=Campylobacter sp. RM9328 TaxID=1705720 RepID=UPI001474CF80|nr:cytochrome c oxidase accessory protein CcoG [Campylobacter sp. RM9328]